MKIGIYGGSFDPPHFGHKNIAEFVIKKLGLDKLFIVPVGIASHGKPALILGEYRMKMCELTFGEIEKAEVSPVEINMNSISYTFKTLETLIEENGSEHEYFEIIGEDSAAYFDKWREYKKILELSTVVVLKRKGFISAINSKKMMIVDNPYFNVSSTEIKDKIKNGEDVSLFLTKETIEFIKEKKLYMK